MATIPAETIEHYRYVQRLQVRALEAGWSAWDYLAASNLSGSWSEVLPDLTQAIAHVQFDAALSGATYSALTLASRGEYIVPDAFSDPTAMVGWSSSGASLEAALYSPIPAVKERVAGGMGMARAMNEGREYLEQLLRTQVADAGRVAASVDIVARPACGYVRMLNPPSCHRCVPLAGRFYQWNAGFRRHPRCDCVHVAARNRTTEAALDEGLIDDPYAYFQGLPAADQDRIFGAGRAQAIRDGADIYQVTNSARGMTPNGMFTTEGTTRRGNASQGLARGQRRMTPDLIYKQATSRAQALELLKTHGYILPAGQVAGGSLRGRVEGFGQMGRGGTRRAASEAVLQARRTGVRDPRSRYTMTAAERRLYDAEQRYLTALQGRSPYTSPGFGNTPDPHGQRVNRIGATSRPVTDRELALAETEYRRWLATGGQIWPQ
ncbi:hypothetical protein [Oerskovia paurometabola]|uniref:MuF-like minor capsid protein n=1 Tax=Oerskovia paurometabola TaxID=162170 RepID=A0ABW1X868_9CELL|nr:hypothetical protein [Oerskovia paurometabola]MBM7497799.1 hypothetical protein [Oerskovia paurometabola]